jgi:hypothetical protein
MTKNVKELLIIGTVLTGLLLFTSFRIKKSLNAKTNKSKENKSSFAGNKFGQRVMFTLKNTSNTKQVVPIFNSYSNIQNPKVSISPSISEFNRTLLNEPKIIKSIEIRAMGNQKQAQMPIQKVCKDASGEFKSKNLYPLVSANQVAQDMTSLTFKDFIASGECYFNYTMKPNQTVVLVFEYDLKKSPKK